MYKRQKEGRANAVKLEGGKSVCPQIKAITQAGIPVVAHLGLTPQSINALGGYKVQGKSEDAAKKLLEDALAVQEAGAFALVLECVPTKLEMCIRDRVEPRDMMTFSAKVENSCEKMTIKAFYISSYGENAWSDNLMKSKVAYGKVSKKMKLRMPADQLRWDLKVITADGKKVIFHELDVSECDSSNITITLMYDEDGNPVAIAV